MDIHSEQRLLEMSAEKVEIPPFAIKDCDLIAIATGKRAQNLRELRQHLISIDLDSIYYHFWGGLLRPRFDDPEFHNDFAIWVHHDLHDKILGERLSLIIPTEFENLEELRQELVEVLGERSDEIDFPLWVPRDNHFEFIRSQIVIFNTHHLVHNPRQFADIIPKLSVGSIFYHFIDSRRRTPGAIDDFRNWIKDFGEEYSNLCRQINEIDLYFSTLTELRSELAEVFKQYFLNY